MPDDFKIEKKHCFWAIGTVVGLWGLNWIVPAAVDKPGIFGDQFGAVNALFSGLAFGGLILAILLQRQELRAQHDVLDLQRQELMLQRKELAASTKAQEATATALGDQLQLQRATQKRQLTLDLYAEWNGLEMQEARDRFIVLLLFCSNGAIDDYSITVLNSYFEAGSEHDESLKTYRQAITYFKKCRSLNKQDLIEWDLFVDLNQWDFSDHRQAFKYVIGAPRGITEAERDVFDLLGSMYV